MCCFSATHHVPLSFSMGLNHVQGILHTQTSIGIVNGKALWGSKLQAYHQEDSSPCLGFRVHVLGPGFRVKVLGLGFRV